MSRIRITDLKASNQDVSPDELRHINGGFGDGSVRFVYADGSVRFAMGDGSVRSYVKISETGGDGSVRPV